MYFDIFICRYLAVLFMKHEEAILVEIILWAFLYIYWYYSIWMEKFFILALWKRITSNLFKFLMGQEFFSSQQIIKKIPRVQHWQVFQKRIFWSFSFLCRVCTNWIIYFTWPNCLGKKLVSHTYFLFCLSLDLKTWKRMIEGLFYFLFLRKISANFIQ